MPASNPPIAKYTINSNMLEERNNVTELNSNDVKIVVEIELNLLKHKYIDPNMLPSMIVGKKHASNRACA
jgi:hypothetical protein